MSTNPAMIRGADTPARHSDSSVDDARRLFEKLFEGRAEALAVELADGTSVYAPRERARATIVARSMKSLRALVLGASSSAAARAIASGELSVRGDVEHAIAQAESAGSNLSVRDRISIGLAALRLPAQLSPSETERARDAYRPRGKKHSLRRDRAAVAYHYDVSNDFYSLWLDTELVYSCAYFRDPANLLDRAQLDKLDHICKKLRLRAGERLLDVGCGWGSLVRFAAREYGATTVGITLSERQADHARKRIAAEGLEQRCQIEMLDYRELAQLGPFDKAASVGMVEHVGIPMLETYFRSVFGALRTGGLFLNHGISSQQRPSHGLAGALERVFPNKSTFIERYVFPDGDLPRLHDVIDAAEIAGFEVRDVENLREHYARTLRHWVRRLEANESAARAAVGDATFNVWRFYLAGSAHGFSGGRMGLDQTLLVKRTADGSAHVPPTRDDIYRA
jgi:cyclopropane-fatty-acyl-phospholipid synthase